MPRVLVVDPARPDPSAIAEAAAALAAGRLVAFPTETVYGLGARARVAVDVARVFAAKGRPKGHPLIVHVDGVEMARGLAPPRAWPDRATEIAAELWPGPLTLVVPRAADVPDVTTGGLATVAVRAPAHAVARALIAAAGEPIAAPSANAHTHVSPTTAAHVVRSLGDAVDLVLDAGPCERGIESTVLDLTVDPPRVLRPGAIAIERLRALVPDVVYEAAAVDGDAARASPGLASKHYAPRSRVVLTSDVAAALAADPEAAVIAWSERAHAVAGAYLLPADPEGYARAIYAALHAVDAEGRAVVIVEAVPDAAAWVAVADRLRRAAGS